MTDLLPESVLPPGFAYPRALVRLIALGAVHWEPWYLLTGTELQDRLSRVRNVRQGQGLVPFAVATSRDDVACFVGTTGRVVVIEDYRDDEPVGPATTSVSFEDWLRDAVDEFIEFGF